MPVRLMVEDANERPIISSAVERQDPSQGTRLQPGHSGAGSYSVEPGETGVEGALRPLQ